jgi:arsenical pump membrane protein
VTAVATLILLAALAGVLFRPGGLHEAAYAAAGAAAMVLVTAEPLDAALGVVRDRLGVLAFLAGVMLIAALAEDAGLFGVAASWALRVSRGRATRLLWTVAAVAFVGTALLSLDATAVALTPVVVAMAARVGAPAEPLLFACIGVANAASIALPGANPTNVIVADRLGIPFGSYAASMLPAALAASLATVLVLRVRFRRPLGRRLSAPAPPTGVVDVPFAALALAAALAALVGFAVLSHELGAVALAAGIAGAVGAVALGRWTPRRLAAGASPALLVLAAGLFVLVDGAERTGWRDVVLDHAPSSAWGMAAAAALLANAVNNLPATLLALPAVDGSRDAAYALLVGVDVGPNLTLTGSLATFLWLTLARERGAVVSPLRFLAIGCLTAPAGIAAAMAVRAVAG